MIIEKTALVQNVCYSPIFFLESARKGEELVLDYFAKKDGYELFLPAYIGFSAKEGSGIYDPVIKSGIRHDFYKINKDITIDVEDLRSKLCRSKVKPIVLLVHYFGYLDKNIDLIVDICHQHNAVIIEDCAHALFTDYIDHQCGSYGDFVLYSIHKMLPYDQGGILKVNNCNYDFESLCSKHSKAFEYRKVFSYDFYKIACIRKRNASVWEELIKTKNNRRIEAVKTNKCDITSQTYPVFIHDYDRTKLYFELNKMGFGVVSLYHTMIKPIEEKYENSVWVSHHIMNLPVHQDVSENQIIKMFEELYRILKG